MGFSSTRRVCNKRKGPAREQLSLRAMGGGSLRWLSRRNLGQHQLNGRADTGLAGQLEAAAEFFHDDRVHDMQTKPRRVIAAPRGEEWFERLTLDLGRHRQRGPTPSDRGLRNVP